MQLIYRSTPEFLPNPEIWTPILFCSETTDGIEMAVLSSSAGSHGDHPNASMTPPVQCSSRNSVVEGNSRGSGGRRGLVPADSMELYMDNKMLRQEKAAGVGPTYLDLYMARKMRDEPGLPRRGSFTKATKHGNAFKGTH